MSLLPVLTHVGLLALQAAKAGGPPVALSAIGLGSAARLPTGAELDIVEHIITAPITSHTLDPDTGQLDLGVQVDGALAGLTADHVIREVGVFDQDGRLIHYWATPDSLGSITPVTAYALNIALTLSTADAAVIQVIDQGPNWGVMVEAAVSAAEARLAQAARQSTFRNLFLAQA